MPMPQLYIIDYRLHGQSRTFIIRQEKMDNAEAWHWASCTQESGSFPSSVAKRSAR
jgi:type II secretory pathway component PulL